MSYEEKKERKRYRDNRRKRIIIIIVACVLVAITLGISLLSYVNIKKNSYVMYTSEGKVVYRAYLADNDFYTEESLNGSHAYVASLIEYMTADFVYELKMEAHAKYRYSYEIDAILDIRDKKSDMSIYNPKHQLVKKEYYTAEATELRIAKSVTFDYNMYNETAKSFLTLYELTDVYASIIIRMNVDVEGINEKFKEDLSNSYVISVSIPLLQPTVAPSVSSTVPVGDSRIQTRDDSILSTLYYLNVASAIVLAILLITLYLFTIFTRDKYLEYSQKVNRILSNYKSYVQKISNPYDEGSGKWLKVEEFSELLEIRDTLQIPILMYEDEDRTCSKFIIVNGDLVYYFTLQVED